MSAGPQLVSWLPVGPVLEAIVALSPADRLTLIVEQAHLSAHFNWGVDPLPVPWGARTHFRKYFSDVVDVHDPRHGVPVGGWPAVPVAPGEGAAARHAAFKLLFGRACGMYAGQYPTQAGRQCALAALDVCSCGGVDGGQGRRCCATVCTRWEVWYGTNCQPCFVLHFNCTYISLPTPPPTLSTLSFNSALANGPLQYSMPIPVHSKRMMNMALEDMVHVYFAEEKDLPFGWRGYDPGWGGGGPHDVAPKKPGGKKRGPPASGRGEAAPGALLQAGPEEGAGAAKAKRTRGL